MKYVKKLTIYLMVCFYTYAGINHFISPDYFLSIMPPYFPWPVEAIYISGFFELVFGIGLLTRYRKYSAWGLIILLVAVFPANIFLIESQDAQNALGITRQTAIIRAPFQLLFLGLAYWHSKT